MLPYCQSQLPPSLGLIAAALHLPSRLGLPQTSRDRSDSHQKVISEQDRLLTVQTDEGAEGGGLEGPRGSGSHDRELALMKVIREDRVETDVRVNDKRESERTVEQTARTVLDCAGCDEGNECDRDEALECPVVGTVLGVGFREGSRVVDGALDVCCGARTRAFKISTNGSGSRPCPLPISHLRM